MVILTLDKRGHRANGAEQSVAPDKPVIAALEVRIVKGVINEKQIKTE